MNVRFLTLVTLSFVPRLGPAQVIARDSVVYELAPSSRFVVRTAKAGLFGFAGHAHLIQTRQFSGRDVYYTHQPQASHLAVSIATVCLDVLTPPDTEEIGNV